MRAGTGHLWRGIGYALTAAWMIAILIVTGSDPAHPWFDFIFVVPLVCWIVAVGVVRLIGRRDGPMVPPLDASDRRAKNREADE